MGIQGTSGTYALGPQQQLLGVGVARGGAGHVQAEGKHEALAGTNRLVFSRLYRGCAVVLKISSSDDTWPAPRMTMTKTIVNQSSGRAATLSVEVRMRMLGKKFRYLKILIQLSVAFTALT